MAINSFDTQYPVCPWCGKINYDCDSIPMHRKSGGAIILKCVGKDSCGRSYTAHVDATISFTTSKITLRRKHESRV